MTGSLFDLPSTPQGPAETVAPKAKQAGLPDAAKRALEAKGLRDPDTGAMRKAQKRRCPTCRRQVWRGIDREFGGLSRDCDPQPLTVAGEVAALMDGRITFDLQYRHGYGHVIDSRASYHIRPWPAGQSGMDVLVEHNHIPHEYETCKTQLVVDVGAKTPDKCPY